MNKRLPKHKVSVGSLTKWLLFLIVYLYPFVHVFAHGDLSIRIAQKTKEISENPNSFVLYYERGLLYLQHIEYDKALEDYTTSKSLGNSNNEVQYRIAEANYFMKNYHVALADITAYLVLEKDDVVAKKLAAQILFELKLYKESKRAYQYVICNLKDIRPEDILEYANIMLVENSNNFRDALDAIEFGLKKLGKNTLSLQLKKLEYLKASNRIKKVVKQYNYFILEYKRKEFWYFRKAQYLIEISRYKEAAIALKLAASAIENLDVKFKNMNAIIKLKTQISSLESLNNQKL